MNDDNDDDNCPLFLSMKIFILMKKDEDFLRFVSDKFTFLERPPRKRDKTRQKERKAFDTIVSWSALRVFVPDYIRLSL